MQKFITLLFAVLLVFNSQLFAQNTEFVNGNWYNGIGFQQTVFYAVNGILTQKKPLKILKTINLEGGYVIPPFADGFSAGIADAPFQERLLAEYAQNGAFYLQVPAVTSKGKEELATTTNLQNTPDVSFPSKVIRLNGSTFKPDNFLDTTNFIADRERVNEMSKRIAQQDWKADVTSMASLKLTLESLRNMSGNYLLVDLFHPSAPPTEEHFKMLKKLVKYAHKKKIKLHLIANTPDIWDFGVRAKADVLIGLPGANMTMEGSDASYDIGEQQITVLKKNKTTVMPLFSYHTLTKQNTDDTRPASEEQKVRLNNYFTKTIKTLASANIPLAIGSNNIGRNNHLEISQFFNIFADSPNNMLQCMSVYTPRIIFPNRKIGALEEGFEANFLVFKTNPIDRIQRYRSIDRRYKLGVEWKK